jgi:hypothetical protein
MHRVHQTFYPERFFQVEFLFRIEVQSFGFARQQIEVVIAEKTIGIGAD